VLATLKELQLAALIILPLFILCSAPVSALVIALNGSPSKRIGKLEIIPLLKEGA
jgi:hypothetical protein